MNENLLILLGLGNAAKSEGKSLEEQIDAILPQTQCMQCDFDGCKPYSEAIVSGEAEINQCPPGGQDGVDALAELLGRQSIRLNETHGETKPRRVAIVDEKACIGCTLCIKACPVDAFVGSSKVMTQVIAKECTGCDLCLPVCPVDCIDMIESKSLQKIPYKDSAQFNDALNQRQILERSIRDNSRERYQFHQARLERDKRERDELLKSRTIALKEKMAKDKAQKEKIQAAMQRIKKSKNSNAIK
jgi:Na+-translocating ferredoxin:NAD+ oxidoreductase subunit B